METSKIEFTSQYLIEGEVVKFVSKADTLIAKSRKKLMFHRLCLWVVILATIHIMIYAIISRWYIILGLFLIMIKYVNCDLEKRWLKDLTEAKLIITNKRVVIKYPNRYKYENTWNKKKWGYYGTEYTTYIDDIIKIDNMNNGIMITARNSHLLKFEYLENADEAFRLLSPLVDRNHHTYN